MRAVDIIFKKREAQSLTESEMRFLIDGYTAGQIPDYQMAAFAMAVFFKGLNSRELAVLTDAIVRSGSVVDLSHLDGIPVGKHSTGGIGDKVTIALMPAVAACGVPAPKMSGRGLGHTGGTKDKLESIPGFQTDLSIEQFRRQLKQIGCAMIGSSDQLAPADKKLYALRDVTATVESLPLIASSIMSKKLAEGTDHVLLDVKFGSGALLRDLKDAQALGQAMVDIGTEMGKKIVARMTTMEQPLGAMIGNALEIKETLDVLEGHGPSDVKELVVELGAEMLVLGNAVKHIESGRQKIHQVLNNGQALEKFRQVIEAQGGDTSIISDRNRLPTSQQKVSFKASQSGYISSIDSKLLGLISMRLGGGRERVQDQIDPRVGIEMKAKVGDLVAADHELCVLHLGDKSAESALQQLPAAFVITKDVVAPLKLFGPRISN